MTRAVAELLLHSFRTCGSIGSTAPVTRALADLLACDLPAAIEVSIPEGYAFYGLYPESYLAAAESVLDRLAGSPLRVIGIRSIGTGLRSRRVRRSAHRGSALCRPSVAEGMRPLMSRHSVNSPRSRRNSPSPACNPGL